MIVMTRFVWFSVRIRIYNNLIYKMIKNVSHKICGMTIKVLLYCVTTHVGMMIIKKDNSSLVYHTHTQPKENIIVAVTKVTNFCLYLCVVVGYKCVVYKGSNFFSYAQYMYAHMSRCVVVVVIFVIITLVCSFSLMCLNVCHLFTLLKCWSIDTHMCNIHSITKG